MILKPNRKRTTVSFTLVFYSFHANDDYNAYDTGANQKTQFCKFQFNILLIPWAHDTGANQKTQFCEFHLTHKAPPTICSRRQFQILLLFQK